jgi:uncharacterized membrane protein YfcA
MNARSLLVSTLNVAPSKKWPALVAFRQAQLIRLQPNLVGHDLIWAISKKPLLLHGAALVALVAYAAMLAATDPAHISLWVMAAIFMAALTSSIAGFAFSAICGAMLFHLLRDPIHVVGIMMVCSIAGQGMMVWSVRREICWRSLLPFLAGAAIGLPLGVHLLVQSRPGFYMPIIGSLLVIYATFMVFRRPMVLQRQHVLWDGCVGFLGGNHGGAAAFPGAFVTIWCSFKGWSKERQRGLYQPFILLVQLAGLGLLSATSLDATARHFRLDGIEYIPATLLGTSCGLACFKWLNDRQFALSVNVLLAVSGQSFLL